MFILRWGMNPWLPPHAAFPFLAVSGARAEVIGIAQTSSRRRFILGMTFPR
jgi:hypothetical protein